MPELKIVSDTVDEFPMVSLSGELDTHSAARVLLLFEELLVKDEPAAMIDLEHLDYIDSAGLGTLVSVLKQITDKSGRLAIVTPSPTVVRVLHVTGLDKVFQMFDTCDQAVEAFRSTRSPLLTNDTNDSG